MKVYLLDQVVDSREEPRHSLHWTEEDARERAVQKAERHGWDCMPLKGKRDTDTCFGALKTMETMYPIKTDITPLELPGLPIDFESKHVEGDAHLTHRLGGMEYHWRNAFGDGQSLVLTVDRNNYPEISLWTMPDAESRESVAKLLADKDGWERYSQMNDPEELEGDPDADAERNDDGE